MENCCNCCSKCCRSISRYFDQPFSCWAIFCVLLLGAGSVISFIYADKYWAVDYCEHNLHIGLLALGICYLVQNFSNFYIVYRYSKLYGRYSEGKYHDKDTKICSVTWRFLCYDFFMCFYIFFLLFSIVWASLYIGYATDRSRECKRKVNISIRMGKWSYINDVHFGRLLSRVCGVVFNILLLPNLLYLSWRRGCLHMLCLQLCCLYCLLCLPLLQWL